MASRMKKIFHRKKDSDAEQPPQQRARAPMSSRSDPALRSSRYETTEPGELPQTGDYPVKGNDSSVILQQGRKSSVSRSRRNSNNSHNVPYRSNTPNQSEAAKHAPRITPPNVAGSSSPYQQSLAMPVTGQEERHRQNVPQDFSGTDLGNAESRATTVTQTITTTRMPNQGYSANRGFPQNHGYAPGSAPQEHGYNPSSHAAPQFQGSPRNNTASQPQDSAVQGDTTSQRQKYAPTNNTTPKHQDYASRNNAVPQLHDSAPRNIPSSQNREYVPQRNNGAIKPVNEGSAQRISKTQPYRGDLSSNPNSNVYDSPNLHGEDDANLARQDSIPRKQIGTSSSTPHSSVKVSSPPRAQIGQSRQQGTPKPLPSTPAAASRGYADDQMDSAPQPSSILNRSRPIPTSQAGLRDAQDVVDRAKTNTHDTEVVESVAPAVVHEKIHKAIHHVREEVITREIHTHDVYHRIQPIVDVEVLPPRHFLPVEGGGLVEISAQEVPGRGSNWVIAETASKIPSDQAAPSKTSQFTARNFPGREGDAVKYMSPEGYEKTEQTWVHPPELEEGARLTGQSWPMVIGREPPGKVEHGYSGAHGFSTPKATKRKSSKNNSTIPASPTQ